MSNIAAFNAALAEPVATRDVIFDALNTMRRHLDMEIAYLSEFVGDKLVFRAIDAPGLEHLAQVGGSRDLSETYCRHILDGALPSVMRDTLDLPLAAAMPITRDLPIRAHVSVPIERSDGSIYGMFCCLSPRPNTTLNTRDLELMRTFARLAQSEVQRTLEVSATHAALNALIDRTLRDRTYDMLYQPIVDLRSGEMAGMEALCRFHSDPYRSPDLWFSDAVRVGKSIELEVRVMETALAALDDIPNDVYLSLNASPDTVASGVLPEIFRDAPGKRLVIEVTEHAAVVDWAALDRALHDLRAMGVRIAIDDAGAGHSGLQQMVRLRPDIIKLDRSLVDCIDEDAARRSLCAAMVHYAMETGARLVAEGIERQEEARALRSLGVQMGQGYLLARPMPMRDAVALCRRTVAH